MKSLAVIVEEASSLERMLVESGGELTPEIEELLKVNKDELSQKVDGYSIIMDRLEEVHAFYKKRSAMYAKAAKAMDNTRDTLKERIKFAMKELKVSEVNGEEVRFQLNKAKPTLKIDKEKEAELMKLYPKTTIVQEIDKEKLLQDLAVGPVEGAELVPNVSLNTYTASPKQIKSKGA